VGCSQDRKHRRCHVFGAGYEGITCGHDHGSLSTGKPVSVIEADEPVARVPIYTGERSKLET